MKVRFIEVNALVSRGNPIDETYVTYDFFPVYVVYKDEDFQYILVSRGFTYNES
jgi:hypothetical protein